MVDTVDTYPSNVFSVLFCGLATGDGRMQSVYIYIYLVTVCLSTVIDSCTL